MAESIAQLVAGLTFVGGLVMAVVAARHDQRTRLLLNKHNAVLASIALVGFSLSAVIEGEVPPVFRLVAGAAVFAGPWLVANIVSPSSIGFGDVKYSAALGLYLGWIDPFLGATAIVLSGVAVVLAVVVRPLRRRLRARNNPDPRSDAGTDADDRTFAFGPFLAIGAVAAAVLGLLSG